MREVKDRPKKRRKRLKNIWNPKNLQKEVHAFGYNFEWKTYLLTFVCVLLLIGAIGVFYRLKTQFIAVLLLIVFVMLPVLIVDMYKRMYEQKRFSDVTDYIEQVLYAFRKNQNVMRALRECKDAMPEGVMKQTIEDAVSYLECGKAKTDKGVLSEALQLIEDAYPCEKIHTVHELLISAENRGGDAERSIELLLEDLEVWKRQVYKLQGDKKSSHINNIMSIVVAALMCGADMYIMDNVKEMVYVGEDISVFNLNVVQISSFMFLVMCLWTFYKSTKKLTDNWLEDDRGQDKAIIKSYQYIKNYDEKKESKKSVLMALPFLVVAVICYVKQVKVGIIVSVLLAAFMLAQHKFSYRMSMKDVEKAMYVAFSQWMMDVALLLQTNNVQMALTKSISKADPILRDELQELTERIAIDPENIQSYTAFCEKFNIPEIASCMKMLYSISELGTGNADVQIENLMQHIRKFQEKEAEIKSEDVAFKMQMVFFIPVAATTIKLLIDMTTGTLLVFQLFSTAF